MSTERMATFYTDDTRIAGMSEVLPAAQLMAELPLSADAAEFVYRTRADFASAIHGSSDRLVVIVGPCSIHDPKAAIEYGRRLFSVSEQLGAELLILMRVYFEKPRTTVGWKGLINDPRLDGSHDIDLGLHLARRLLVDLASMGVPTATEYLDPITPQYIGDAVAWSAIGARTSESQIHRQLASGLSCPVGFKNATSGSAQIAIDAVRCAREPHNFLSVNKQGRCAIVRTQGNQDCHVILRGGESGPNFGASDIAACCELLADHDLPQFLMVDCSHGNSGKLPTRQVEVARSVGRQIGAGNRRIFGVMIESNLVGGRQEIATKHPLTYGQSVTDACIDWTTTEQILAELATVTALRRRAL